MNESSASGNNATATIDPLRTVFHAIPEFVSGTLTSKTTTTTGSPAGSPTVAAALADNPLAKRNKAINRKTSAEIVQEAKNMLSRGTTPHASMPGHNSMQHNSSASTLKFDGSFKVSGESRLRAFETFILSHFVSWTIIIIILIIIRIVDTKTRWPGRID